MRVKSFFFLLFLSCFILGLNSCKDEDDSPEEFPALDEGPVEVDKIVITYTQAGTSSNPHIDSAVAIDLDGPGGNMPQIQDSLELIWLDNFGRNISYNAQIKLYYRNLRVDSIVQDNAERFIVCFRNYQTQELDLVRRNQDANGFPLGLESDWITDGDPSNTAGIGTIRITLNYQAARKEGLCDAGIRKLEINLPYRLI
jgi:hypothetical protein